MGFEPTDAFTSPVFKTGAFDHSAISPCAKASLMPNACIIIPCAARFVNKKGWQEFRKSEKQRRTRRPAPGNAHISRKSDWFTQKITHPQPADSLFPQGFAHFPHLFPHTLCHLRFPAKSCIFRKNKCDYAAFAFCMYTCMHICIRSAPQFSPPLRRRQIPLIPAVFAHFSRRLLHFTQNPAAAPRNFSITSQKTLLRRKRCRAMI